MQPVTIYENFYSMFVPLVHTFFYALFPKGRRLRKAELLIRRPRRGMGNTLSSSYSSLLHEMF